MPTTLLRMQRRSLTYVETFEPTDWTRTMTYYFPERAERPLTWVVRHTVHEGEHHLLDIGRVLRAARAMSEGTEQCRPSDAGERAAVGASEASGGAAPWFDD